MTTVKITKTQLRNLIREAIREQLELQGETEAMNDIFNWMFVGNPQGATKQEFLKYLNQDLTKKYNKHIVAAAFKRLKDEKGCLEMQKTPGGKEVVVWSQKQCRPKSK